MHLSPYLAACLLAPIVGAINNVPGSPQYLGSDVQAIEPSGPGIQGRRGDEEDRQFFEAMKTPNMTGSCSFATPNITAPPANGTVTAQLPGWSLSVAVRANAQYPRNGEYYVAGTVHLNTPESLLTNMTIAEDGQSQKNVSAIEPWKVCVTQWALDSRPYPSKMRSDDGTCSSVLSPGCIRGVQAAARRDCKDPQIQSIPACANDDTTAFQSTSYSYYLPASKIRRFPQGHAQLWAFATETAPGAQNFTSYNDMGTVAWPVLLSLGDGKGGQSWSGLFCVRPTKAVNGSTLPVWEDKEEKNGGEGEGGNEGKDDDKNAAIHTAAGKASLFVLSAATLAWLML